MRLPAVAVVKIVEVRAAAVAARLGVQQVASTGRVPALSAMVLFVLAVEAALA